MKLYHFFVFIILSTPALLFGQPNNHMGHENHWMCRNWWGSQDTHMMGGGIIMWFIFFILAGLVIYLFVKVNRTQTSNEIAPLDILKQRYAKGEINKEEFEQKKKDLI